MCRYGVLPTLGRFDRLYKVEGQTYMGAPAGTGSIRSTT
jgi:hypothetical protein